MTPPLAAVEPADRRPVTVLFADLSGFTSLSEQLDPEEVRDLQTDLFAAMRGALDDAGLDPSSVDYVNMHGTGTRANDAMEDRAIATLKDTSANPGQVAQAVNSGLRDLDGVMGHMQAARAAAGSTLNRLDALDGRNQDRALWAKSVQADAEDLDMVQAISTFQNQQTGYQAALQSYAMVQRMSLFDYVK